MLNARITQSKMSGDTTRPTQQNSLVTILHIKIDFVVGHQFILLGYFSLVKIILLCLFLYAVLSKDVLAFCDDVI